MMSSWKKLSNKLNRAGFQTLIHFEFVWEGKYAIQVLYDSMEDLGADMAGMVGP